MLATGRYAHMAFNGSYDTLIQDQRMSLRKCILHSRDRDSGFDSEDQCSFDLEKEAIHLILTGIGDEIY
ncbi:hypothetical protein Tco_1125228 [Tanacetum coccineum]|uniref:Uncharacterized protein n=1 Tax=Tanacetum coccineum TaxID=301880 RepID=A0ABQ5J8I3_9ASTR